MTEFVVITKVPDMDDPAECTGNLALALDVYVPVEEEKDELNPDRYEPVLAAFGMNALMFRAPVFGVGEVLICKDGREVPYPGRKPSKWYVEYEEFTNIEEALARAEQVMGYETTEEEAS